MFAFQALCRTEADRQADCFLRGGLRLLPGRGVRIADHVVTPVSIRPDLSNGVHRVGNLAG